MQPPTAGPRSALTTAQVVGLIQDSPGLTVGCGAELTDLTLNTLADVSADLAGGSVSRASYANLHGTAQLTFSTELDWGAAILRPYLTLTAGTVTARFNLGAYYTATPDRNLQDQPPTYDVQCYDILSVLDDPVGDAYALDAGTGYLAAVETVLLARGVTGYLIDQQATASVLPTDRVWAFDPKTTWLSIVNDLLLAIGYQGIWSDWDGRLRCQPYVRPVDRAPEWTYDTGALTSMLSVDRTVTRDFYAAPNRWVFYRTNLLDGAAPVEGDGLYTVQNDGVGLTSVQARRRIITREPIGLDVADHTALVAAAQRTIDADMQIPTKLQVKTSPMPLSWHFDRGLLDDPAVGPPEDILVTQWTLPLNGDEMSQEWTVI